VNRMQARQAAVGRMMIRNFVLRALKVDAATLTEADMGARVRTTKPVSLWYYDGKFMVPKGVEVTVDGMSPPDPQTDMHLYGSDLAEPEPGRPADRNLRIRVLDEAGNEFLITTSELETAFELAAPRPSVGEEDTEPSAEVPKSLRAPATPATPSPTQMEPTNPGFSGPRMRQLNMTGPSDVGR